jgi:carboxypeptidase Taq
MTAHDAYQTLKARFARIATLDEAAAMLNWDASAMMPEGGGKARGDQLALLAGLSHGMLIAPETGDLLAQAETASFESPWDQANLRLMRRAHLHATALPGDLVEAQTRANSACEKVWRQARAASNFTAVRPALAEVVRLAREQAGALAAATGLAPYDSLMSLYQPGVHAADVQPVFDDYERFLAEALPAAEALQARREPPEPLAGPFPASAQEALCRAQSARLGLDYRHARLDRSAHPFCGGTPTDVRITTRYDESNFASALFGVVHETGHALYERGLPEARARQPVGTASGMAVHESQSLIIEMQVCRSDPYFRYLSPHLAASFGGAAERFAPDRLARQFRRVARGFIRVDADEMTYPAHVILRFRLEQALIAGDLAVADLPGAWNEGFKALLGIAVPDDARGCLQDIHWYDGLFGYFPSYTLGAMAAAQLMAAARRALPDCDAAIAAGEFGPLTAWLRANVHENASLLEFPALMRQATGKPLDPADFLAHLNNRYLV